VQKFKIAGYYHEKPGRHVYWFCFFLVILFMVSISSAYAQEGTRTLRVAPLTGDPVKDAGIVNLSASPIDQGTVPSVDLRQIGPGYPPVKRVAPRDFFPATSGLTYTKKIADIPALYWSYGCAATSATMLFGYYDRNGYPDLYSGPANSGVFPLNNSVWGASPEGFGECPLSASHRGIDGRSARGHADDYYSGYYSSADPYFDGGWTEHSPHDSAADFMGTSQYHNWQNPDGATMYFFDPGGDPTVDFIGMEWNGMRDATHGMKLFAESRGYVVTSNYNQYISGYNGHYHGFTYDQYKAEIDSGYPVLIILNNHVMLGVGYDEPGKIVVHDTWDYAEHTMAWGGTYGGMTHIGVSVFHLARPFGSRPPVANFTISPVTGPVPLTVRFNDTSTGAPTAWKWYFGDGNFSTGRNPTHTYTSSGNFMVILAASNETTGLSDIRSGSVRVTSTGPGISWDQANVSAGFVDRKGLSAIVYHDRMWVIGGMRDWDANDVWYTDDGIIWTEANASAAFDGRSWHTSAVYDNRMWVIGGLGDFESKNDVWYSDNGVTWVQATEHAEFSSRYGHNTVVFDNRMWVIGGNDNSNVKMNDVWYTDDGIHWTQATGSAAFPGRMNFGLVVFDNKMWIIGGYDYYGNYLNDVWYTGDGIIWTEATGSAAFSPRCQHTSVVFDDRMWVIAGYDGWYNNDVWNSRDGVNWSRVTVSADFPVRDQAASVVFHNRIWEIGGFVGGAGFQLYNDVWYSPPMSAPIANFIAEPSTGTAPLPVKFVDISTDPAMWNWSFGDKKWFNTTNRSLISRAHIYKSGGNYTARLIVCNAAGCNATAPAKMIRVRAQTPPIVKFTALPVNGTAPLAVKFADISEGTAMWNWSFGDKKWFNTTNRSLISRAHIYKTAGNYTAKLIACNAAGCNTTAPAKMIRVGARTPPIVKFTALPVNGTAPLAVKFADISDGTAMWNWSFGDKKWFNTTNRSLISRAHIYKTAGNYTAKLIACNAAGCNTTAPARTITAT
jgi:PKD repeat protein